MTHKVSESGGEEEYTRTRYIPTYIHTSTYVHTSKRTCIQTHARIAYAWMYVYVYVYNTILRH